MDVFGNPPGEMQTQVMASLGLIIFQIGLAAALLKLAVDNIRAAFENPSHWPEITMVVSIFLMLMFDVQLLGTIMQTAPRSMIGLFPGELIDNVFSGVVISGGAGKLADALKKAANKKQEHHDANIVAIKNGH